MSKKILVASGQKIIDDSIRSFEDYEEIGVIQYRKELYEACEFYKPDILLVAEALGGKESLVTILFQIVKDFPSIRIIYLAGNVDFKDELKVNSLGLLIMAGVTDVIHESKISIQMLKHILDTPKTQEDMAYLIKKVQEGTGNHKNNLIQFEIPKEENDEEDADCYKNLHVFSSIKPGSGKTFLSTNVACAIASSGVNTKEGKKPRVALIEADLNGLGLGTFLHIEDEKKNLTTVLYEVQKVVNEDGEFIGDLKQTEEVNYFMRNCFIPYDKVKNLEVLVGSQNAFSEKQYKKVKPFYFLYIIEALITMDCFDVIIVDTNSSFQHVSTMPLMQMAKNCYFVMNLDFNNIRNNARYKEYLFEQGLSHKAKYVLNEDIAIKADSQEQEHSLIFTANHIKESDFVFEAKIPIISKTTILNSIYEGKPIILSDEENTEKARYEISKLANNIWPIKNLKQMEERLNQKNSVKKSSSILDKISSLPLFGGRSNNS